MVDTQQEKLDRARELLIEATKILTDVVEGGMEKTKAGEEWMQNRLEFWSRILINGGAVTQDKAREIWQNEMKKDIRGYGGNFVGKKASLQYTHDGSVILTQSANEKCQAWTGKTLEQYAQQFKKK